MNASDNGIPHEMPSVFGNGNRADMLYSRLMVSLSRTSENVSCRFSFGTCTRALLTTALVMLCITFLPTRAISVDTQILQEPPELDAARHKLAAGDFLIIHFFDGERMNNLEAQVDAEGEIALPYIGNVDVSGLTPREASELLKIHYTKYYKNPTVSIQIRNYGIFDIFVFGPDFPGRIFGLTNGSHLLDLVSGEKLRKASTGAYRRLFLVRGGGDLMAQLTGRSSRSNTSSTSSIARGEATEISLRPPPLKTPSETGSLAEKGNWRAWIEERLRDPHCTVEIVDPLALTLEGELSEFNFELADGDVVYIPSPERFIDIEGVTRAGRYELLSEETLGDILRISGSVTYGADLANTIVQRYNNEGKLERIVVNLYPALDDASVIADFPLENRDKISVIPREERVFVLGEVNEAGAFNYTPDSTVLDYIAFAKGETSEAHLPWIAVIRQARDLRQPDKEPEVFRINFKEIHKGLALSSEFAILPGDVIYVPPKGFRFKVSEILTPLNTLVTAYSVMRSLEDDSSSTPAPGSDGSGSGTS